MKRFCVEGELHMNRLLKCVSAVAVTLCVLAGCAADPAIKPWWTLREADFRQLQPGKTTAAEVRTVLGKPGLEMTFTRQGEEVWDYRYLDGTMYMLAWVYFDGRGVYKYFVGQRDPAQYNADGSF